MSKWDDTSGLKPLSKITPKCSLKRVLFAEIAQIWPGFISCSFFIYFFSYSSVVVEHVCLEELIYFPWLHSCFNWHEANWFRKIKELSMVLSKPRKSSYLLMCQWTSDVNRTHVQNYRQMCSCLTHLESFQTFAHVHHLLPSWARRLHPWVTSALIIGFPVCHMFLPSIWKSACF